MRPLSDGVDFLGDIVRRDYRLVRRRVVNAPKARLRAYQTLLVSEHAETLTYRFEGADLERLHAVLSSYLGHFKRANAYTLWQALWRGHGWLAVYFDWNATAWRLKPRW